MLASNRISNFNADNTIECNRINVGEDDEYVLQGYTSSILGILSLIILTILSGGILLLVIVCRPSLRVRITNRPCSLEQAQLLILRDKYDNEFVEKVHFTQRDKSFCFIYFFHKKLKYVWRNEYKHFTKLKGLENERCSIIYSQAEGATSPEALIKLNLYGKNSIEIELLPIWRLILDEITGPFYLYQFFICSIWLMQLYYQFATCILFLSIISVVTHVWQTRKQTIELRKKVQSASNVTVIRDQQPTEICSTELVPGDVINLPKHTSPFFMECDAILITGSCIVDESMLTGESVPVPKVTMVENSNTIYSSTTHKSSTLFSGTRVLNVKSNNQNSAKAIVVRTGFSTAKGELARSILFPMQSNNHLKNQMMKISAIFFVIGIPCMAYTVYALGRFEFSFHDICINVLDVATFLIPPVLPAVLTSLNVHAQRRLKTKGIYCLSPRMISCAGEVDVMCFDKTGTLTEDSIDFVGSISVENQTFQTIKGSKDSNIITKSMATCHSLVEYGGNVEGDDLDIKLFAASGWKFTGNIDPDQIEKFCVYPERIVKNGNEIIGIIKQFPFESFLQRMLVITKNVNDDKFVTIIKGAPEIVASFCLIESIPKDFTEIFETYTRKGFRVLASASKELDVDVQECLDLNRNDLECKMTFNGLYLFKNKLKTATCDVIKELTNADIRCIMATGDNLLTGISVAEECNLIKKSDAIVKVRAFIDMTSSLRVYYNYSKYPDIAFTNNNSNFEQCETCDNVTFNYHLAIDGDSYNAIKSCDLDLLNKIVHKCAIFARMSPDQKLSLINLLQKQDHRVGMCGANDCGALRAADSGISLSVAEASVASPFTYKKKDISCVPTLIKEGRCTLVAVFGAFKYQVCYCFILLGAVLILFWNGTKPSDGNYVFIDIILNILPPILFGTTAPFKKLAKKMPARNILSLVPQLSMYSFILIQVSLYYYVYSTLIDQPWYVPVHVNLDDIGDPVPNHLANAIFSVNMMSYVIAAIIFSPGPPYRNDFWSNKMYIAVVVFNFLLSGCVSIIAPKFLLNYLRFQEMPAQFRINLFIISIANFVICFVWERFILNEIILKKIIPQIKARMKIRSSKKFNAIQEQIEQDNWPLNNIASYRLNKTNNLNDDKSIDFKIFNRFHSETNL